MIDNLSWFYVTWPTDLSQNIQACPYKALSDPYTGVCLLDLNLFIGVSYHWGNWL